MITGLLSAVIAGVTAFLLFGLRHFFLTVGKERKPVNEKFAAQFIQTQPHEGENGSGKFHRNGLRANTEGDSIVSGRHTVEESRERAVIGNGDDRPTEKDHLIVRDAKPLNPIARRKKKANPKMTCWMAFSAILLMSSVSYSNAQESENDKPKQVVILSPANTGRTKATSDSSAKKKRSDFRGRERLLLERIERLERRLAELESRGACKSNAATVDLLVSTTESIAPDSPSEPASEVKTTIAPTTQITDEERDILDFFRETTFNVTLDGYYSYNFNMPVGRINLLRAYDVSHNSFSLNQAAIVIERAPNVEAGKWFGLRLDLQYGQATETVQGSAANELRPQTYRHVWQAYGTYVAPVGNGLTMDFGKFASSLGFESNYSKDNLNYSRSYFFNFLPFYHLGLRAKYPVNNKLTVMYHLVNGAQQSEDFNHFKSQHVALILTPTNRVTWQVNYYAGREQRNLVADLNPTFPSLPTQPGSPTQIVRPSPRGRFHVLDTYATFNVTNKLTFAAEADYVINRVEDFSPPSRVTGGAAYLRYQFTPRFALAGRAEYLSDQDGLFSGATQALKETTLTADFKLADGFVLRGEWRRDFSNQEFFLTDVPGIRKTEQNTATVGLVWWIGRKQGSW